MFWSSRRKTNRSNGLYLSMFLEQAMDLLWSSKAEAMLFLMATQQQLDLQTTCKHGSIATKRNNKIFSKN
uniref:Uncharacterized protein n=1 Tax=Anguilla anguilla TaxID=7936 RepID=A0A0E9R578_ANGAN